MGESYEGNATFDGIRRDRLCALLGAGLPASAQIKIGAVLSVTGPASFLGDPEKKTLEMYVDDDQRQRRRQRPEAPAGRL